MFQKSVSRAVLSSRVITNQSGYSFLYGVFQFCNNAVLTLYHLSSCHTNQSGYSFLYGVFQFCNIAVLTLYHLSYGDVFGSRFFL
jgi:hypothetical protein